MVRGQSTIMSNRTIKRLGSSYKKDTEVPNYDTSNQTVSLYKGQVKSTKLPGETIQYALDVCAGGGLWDVQKRTFSPFSE